MRRSWLIGALLVVVAACGGGATGEADQVSDSSVVSTSPTGGDSDATGVESPDDEVSSAQIDEFLAFEPVFVDVVPSLELAKRAIIGVDGGEVSATGADGTMFTLTVPAGSLDADTHIEIAPSSGLGAHSVTIEPDALVLNAPATLQITPTSRIEQPATYWTDMTGRVMSADGFQMADGSLMFSLLHFSSYGVGAEGTFPTARAATDAAYAAARAALKDGLTDEETTKIGDIVSETWQSFTYPLLKRASTECLGSVPFHEYFRLLTLDQKAGGDRLTDRLTEGVRATALSKVLASMVDMMKTCARQDCREGKASAVADFANAVELAMFLDIPLAEVDLKELAEARGPTLSGAWKACKQLRINALFSLDITATFPEMSYSTTETVSGSGVLKPGQLGHEGAFAVRTSDSGVKDAASRTASIIATSILNGFPVDDAGTCSMGEYPRGRMEATLSWANPDLPQLTLVPFVGAAPVKCGDIETAYAPLVFALQSAESFGMSTDVTHTFTDEEKFLPGSGPVIGYLWSETNDVAPLLGSAFLTRAEVGVVVRLRVSGYDQVPMENAPERTGLINGVTVLSD